MSARIYVNGRIHSPASPDATAMAVEGDTVVWLGADRPGLALHPDAEVIDLDGAFLAPAFVDPHVHLTDTGLAATGLDLSAVTGAQELLDALARHAESLPEGDPVWGHGWDETDWADPRLPTAAQIDAAAPGREVYLSRIDLHSALASGRSRTGVDADPAAPLTGGDHETVRTRVRAALPAAVLAEARIAALDTARTRGVVAVHECGGPQIGGHEDFAAVTGLDHPVEVVGYWAEAVSTAAEASALIAKTGARGLAGDLMVDGALGSRTAWVTGGYADAADAGTGNRYLGVDEITAHLRACTEAGIQAGFHAIGDGAVTAVAEAFGRVADDLGGPALARLGHRIEHVEMIDEAAVARLGRLGAIASIQPMFDALWGGAEGMYAARLGAERAAVMNPWVRMAAAGMSLAIGSDSPVTPLDPWAAVRAATAHHTPGSSVSARAAFTAATRGAWRAGGVRDGITGMLVPGAPAHYAVWDAPDLVVAAPDDSVQRWSTDPRSRVPALPDLSPGASAPRCLRTVRAGTVIHQAPR